MDKEIKKIVEGMLFVKKHSKFKKATLRKKEEYKRILNETKNYSQDNKKIIKIVAEKKMESDIHGINTKFTNITVFIAMLTFILDKLYNLATKDWISALAVLIVYIIICAFFIKSAYAISNNIEDYNKFLYYYIACCDADIDKCEDSSKFQAVFMEVSEESNEIHLK